MRNQLFLPALQILRGLAALMVVFHHLWHELCFFFGTRSLVLDQLAADGKYGVDFFFVLSGFIICYAHFDKAGISSFSSKYLKNRALRIYIPYLPISLLMLFSYWFFPGLSDASRDVSVVKSLFLLPVPGVTALAVAWTLVHEVFFYLVFVTFFISKRLLYGILLIWTVLIGIYGIGGATSGGYLVAFLLSPYNLEFIIGVCCALFVKVAPPVYRKGVMFGLAAILTISYFSPVILENKILLGLLFATIILIAIHSPLNRISSGNLLMILGNASYSIYLIHDPEISLFMRIFPKSSGPFYITIISLFIFLTAIVSGVIYSRIFEQYFLAKIKGASKPGFWETLGMRRAVKPVH